MSKSQSVGAQSVLSALDAATDVDDGDIPMSDYPRISALAEAAALDSLGASSLVDGTVTRNMIPHHEPKNDPVG